MVNAQSGGWGEGDEKTPARPSDFFGSLEHLAGEEGQPDDSAALIRALKSGTGAIDKREG